MNIRFFILPEPDEDLQDNFEFLYFVITSLDKNNSQEKFVCQANLLQHPYYLSGNIASSIYNQALCPTKGDKSTEVDLSCLPLINMETMQHILEDSVILQKKVLKRILGNLAVHDF